MTGPDGYHVEGVMTAPSGGWLLALDRPYAGDDGDVLRVENGSPGVLLTVTAVVESDDGSTRDVVVAPPPELPDPRYLTGRDLCPVALP